MTLKEMLIGTFQMLRFQIWDAQLVSIMKISPNLKYKTLLIPTYVTSEHVYMMLSSTEHTCGMGAEWSARHIHS